MSGWIKIHRKIQQWTWWQQPQTMQLFIYLLLNANSKEKEYKGIAIRRGQLLTSRRTIAHNTGLSEQQVRTALTRLVSTGEVKLSTTRMYTLITIANYEQYQTAKPGQKKKKDTDKMQKPNIEEIAAYCRRRLNNVDAAQFFDYYESTGWHMGTYPMKDWKAAIRMWERKKKGTGSINDKHHQGKKYERF